MNSSSRLLVMMASIAASMALPLSTAQAGSGNELYLLQESSEGAIRGNNLLVDQSGASNSLVIGPSQQSQGRLNGIVNSSANRNVNGTTNNGANGNGNGNSENAGNRNGLGNTNGLVLSGRGAQNGASLAPATQRGEANSATLTITGEGGEIQLLQDNSGAGNRGNNATVTVNGNADCRRCRCNRPRRSVRLEPDCHSRGWSRW
jgi:hypothetical protein